jgi:hypothetical protein
MRDGGLDVNPLTKEDLTMLMNDQFCGEWRHVTFTFSEMLAYYGGFDLNGVQAVSWCFSALAIGESCRKLDTTWGNHLYVLTVGFIRIRKLLTYDEFTSILTRALSPFDDVDEAGCVRLS